ncbi:Patatin/Phospholipase A2-related [Aphelenchoides avenae]|nr:Patatin/Phospholipase A2-related [Aphelenchus avenae]
MLQCREVLQSGSISVLKILLSINADVDATNEDGKRPLDLCRTEEIRHYFEALTPKRNFTDSDSSTSHLMQKGAIKNVKQQLLNGCADGYTAVLSLDGGGVRGIITARILMELETRLQCGSLLEYFGFMAGTSTGGILALALSSGYSPFECIKLYFELKDDVFGSSRPYDEALLEEFLKAKLGRDATMRDVEKTKLLITATRVDVSPPELVLFRNYGFNGRSSPRTREYYSPKDVPLWWAARASSAAPTYFKRAKDPTKGFYFLDRGITANNPTMEALSDIHEVNVAQKIAGANPLKTACIVSIGTGRTKSKASSNELDVNRPKDLFSTVPTYRAAKNLLNLLLEQVACSDGAVVRRSECWAHSLGVPFFRFTPTLDKNVELDETDDDTLIEALWTTAVHLKTVWRNDIDDLVGLLQLLKKKESDD